MTTFVFLAVLFGALCHAGWNVLIKVGINPLAAAALITAGSGLVAVAALPFTGNPAAEAWPWLGASVVIHFFYFASLVESYRTGDLGQVYPIARGAAPLMTAAAATFVVAEPLALGSWIGIAILAAGVVLLSARGGRDIATIDLRAVGFALLTAVTICAYSVVDGVGARASGNPESYVLWLQLCNAVLLMAYTVWRDGREVVVTMRRFWVRALVGGVLQVLSYGIALWAMTLAPIAVVAALRETSVLFGAAIAVVVLKEPLRVVRIVAAIMIVGGLVLIRLH